MPPQSMSWHWPIETLEQPQPSVIGHRQCLEIRSEEQLSLEAYWLSSQREVVAWKKRRGLASLAFSKDLGQSEEGRWQQGFRELTLAWIPALELLVELA